MFGNATPAGHRRGPRNFDRISELFLCRADVLARAVERAETAANPEVIFLQRTVVDDGDVAALAIYSSGWSRSYQALASPYGRTHRDFHYQVLFTALNTLVQAKCTRVKLDCPMIEQRWRWDAYVCVLEAVKNIQALIAEVQVRLVDGTYDPRAVRDLESRADEFHLQAHRPVGISPYEIEGLSIQTVFVETASVALAMDRAHAPPDALQ